MRRLIIISIFLCLLSTTVFAQQTDSNTIYDIFVDDSGSSIGRYTARTGAAHPVTIATGAAQNVLYNGVSGTPGTSFNTIRSYSTGTDYVQETAGTTSANTLVNLDGFHDSTTAITGGIRTRWVVNNGSDNLEVLQDVKVNGTTFNNSVIEITMTVTNLGTSNVSIGVRYLWDFQIGLDDGLPITPVNPNGATIFNEVEYIAPNFQYYYIEDNDLNTSAPIFRVNGSAVGPSLTPSPVAPSAIRMGCWVDAFGTAFDYTVNSSRDIATTASDCRGFAGGDTAIMYYWGHNSASAITIAPQASHTVRAFIFATPPGPRDFTDTDGDGLFDEWENGGFDFDNDGILDVNLPALGADPNVPDIFIYYDWTNTVSTNYQPSAAALQMVVDAFAAQGVNMHFIQGQAVPEVDGLNNYNTLGSWVGNSYDWTEFAQMKSDYLPAEWWPLAHYLVLARAIDPLGISGISRNPSNTFNEGASDFIVSLGLWGFVDAADSDQAYAGTIMHELGHNLGLGHGGVNVDGLGNRVSANHTNRKPNHLSVMSYNYQTDGLITRANAASPFVLGRVDYSIFDSNNLATLNETNLDETVGLGGTAAAANYATYYTCFLGLQTVFGLNNNPVDWNCDGDATDANAQVNINNDAGIVNQDFVAVDEWDHIIYSGGAIGDFGIVADLPLITDTSFAPEIDVPTYEELVRSIEEGPDADGDGIPNGQDACPWRGDEGGLGIDENGCPYYDADWDGFFDRNDDCPWQGNEGGLGIDDVGCPYYDADWDGFFDRDDACPWRADEYGFGIDDVGCPIEGDATDEPHSTQEPDPNHTEEWTEPDYDWDGILNEQDACPWQGNEGGLGIDEFGCPYYDADWDGVYNRYDDCPWRGNEYGLGIDEFGCPIEADYEGTQEVEPSVTEAATFPDADNDGVSDDQDDCPTQGFEVGTGIDEFGCPLPAN